MRKVQMSEGKRHLDDSEEGAHGLQLAVGGRPGEQLHGQASDAPDVGCRRNTRHLNDLPIAHFNSNARLTVNGWHS